jgi:hypothetical protein
MSKKCFQSVCPSSLVLQVKLLLLNRGWSNKNEANPDIHTSLKKCKIKQMSFGWTINFTCAALYTYIPT